VSCITDCISNAGYFHGPRENHRYEVSFRSLSGDSQVHPDAASAVVKVPDAQANSVEFDSSHVAQAIIFGDYYGLMCKRVCSNGLWVDVLQVWNWKIKDWYRVSERHPTSSSL
jgi:hypothetical protein